MLTLAGAGPVSGWPEHPQSGYTGLERFRLTPAFSARGYTTARWGRSTSASPYLPIPLAAGIGALSGWRWVFPPPAARVLLSALAMLVIRWRAAVRLRAAGLPGGDAADAMRERPAAYMQFRTTASGIHIALAGMLLATMAMTMRIERALRHGAACCPLLERGRGRGRRHRHLRLETQGHHASGAVAGAVGAFYAVVLLVSRRSRCSACWFPRRRWWSPCSAASARCGAVIGSAILIPVAEILHRSWARAARHPGRDLRAAVTAIILMAPEGLYWKLRDRLTREPRAAAPMDAAAGAAIVAPAAESVAGAARATARGRTRDPRGAGLTRQFGGLKAVDEVSFRRARHDPRHHRPQRRRQDHRLQPAQRLSRGPPGEVLIDGAARWAKPHQIREAGVGRTFQIMRPSCA